MLLLFLLHVGVSSDPMLMCASKFRAMNCGIQRSMAIWKLSDRKVFMRHLGNKERQPILSDFVVQKPLIQFTFAKRLDWDPREEDTN